MQKRIKKSADFEAFLKENLSGEDFMNLAKKLKISKRRLFFLLKSPEVGTVGELMIIVRLIQKRLPEYSIINLLAKFDFGTKKRYSYSKK